MAFEMTEGALLGLCRERGMYAHRPELNEVLHVTDRGVLRIAGLAAFSGLRALYLEGNAVEDIEGLEGCPDLRCLYLARNAIEEVGPGLAPLARLTTLDLSSNLLEGAALAGLAGLRELRTLSLGHNHLARRADLEPLAALPVLEALDVSNNRIDDPAACALVQSLPLKWLRFLGNPVVRATAGYQKVFLAAMHATLESLDDHPAFEADTRCALAWAQGGVEAERAERQRIRDEEAARRVRQQERFQAIVEEARTKPPDPRDPMRFRAVPVGESDDELSEPDRGQDGPTPGPSPDAGGGFLEGAGQEEEAEEEEEEEEDQEEGEQERLQDDVEASAQLVPYVEKMPRAPREGFAHRPEQTRFVVFFGTKRDSAWVPEGDILDFEEHKAEVLSTARVYGHDKKPFKEGVTLAELALKVRRRQATNQGLTAEEEAEFLGASGARHRAAVQQAARVASSRKSEPCGFCHACRESQIKGQTRKCLVQKVVAAYLAGRVGAEVARLGEKAKGARLSV